MKKLLILMLVLGLASSANAVVIDLHADDADTLAVTLTPLSPTVEVSVYSDTAGYAYERIVTVDTAGTAGGIGTFTAMTVSSNAGRDGFVTNPYYLPSYTWAYLVSGLDKADPTYIVAGEHFWMDYTATLFAGDGSVQQIVDLRNRDVTWSLIESMVITQVPEPATIALLGLGSLFLLRRRRK